jgi:hypothetical protein
MYKNNSRDSSKFKGCSPLQLSCNLTGKCHAIGYYSYTNRCMFMTMFIHLQELKNLLLLMDSRD